MGQKFHFPRIFFADPDKRTPALTDTAPRLSPEDIERLIARCTLGDRAAFAALYDATSAKLHAVCLRVLGRSQAAEDALQESYVKVWTHAGRYRVTGHSPMTWLITIARNTAIDHLRAQRGHQDVAEYHDILPAPDATPEENVLAASETGRIRACLQELPGERRVAITGAYLDGLSYAALAERAGVPLNTMRTWLRRGLIALRECMGR